MLDPDRRQVVRRVAGLAALSEEEARELYHQAELAVVERLLADAPGAPATARQAVAWAEEAGLVASANGVLVTLDGHRVFAEELFFDLLTSLGIRRVEQPEPIGHPATDGAQ